MTWSIRLWVWVSKRGVRAAPKHVRNLTKLEKPMFQIAQVNAFMFELNLGIP